MGRKKTSTRPAGEVGKPNFVAAAVELAGGAAAVAKLCGVKRQSVYWWIKEWKVERLADAIRLSRASGIPIEKLAGYGFDPARPAEVAPTKSRRSAMAPAEGSGAKKRE